LLQLVRECAQLQELGGLRVLRFEEVELCPEVHLPRKSTAALTGCGTAADDSELSEHGRRRPRRATPVTCSARLTR
jgi:hypothetical protein